MFHFMRKEKSEEERAEKEERKRRKKELKERKKRDSLTSEDLHRLEEVRRSLRIKVTTKVLYFTVLRIRIRCFCDPWIRDPGWEINSDTDPGSRMIISDHISESLETIL